MASVSNLMPGGSGGNFLEDGDGDLTAIRIKANNINGKFHFMDLIRLNINIEIHLSTAFVKFSGSFRCKEDADECILESPMNQRATATACSIVLDGGRGYESEVVSREEVERYAKNVNESHSKYNPDAFSFPFERVKKDEEVQFEFTYFETLTFSQGSYRIKVPMTFSEYFKPSQPLESVITFRSTINTGTIAPAWYSSHMLIPLFESQNRYELKNDNTKPWANVDIEVGYSIQNNQINCTVLNQEPSKTDPKGHFCIFSTPPTISNASLFGRRVVFILDKSGSMAGSPMQHALNAISQGIGSLTPRDFFTIIAFSENQYFFSKTLVPATEENTSAAISWTQALQAAGLTDIKTPLQNALDLLDSSESVPEAKLTVPSVFLITDGAVENEKDICTAVKIRKTTARINTFGVGVYCNHVFLKMLASIGRGYCEVAYKTKNLYDQMMYLINMTNAPVLTDVRIGIANSAYDIEIFPHPIPDLFAGGPIVISGTYSGYFPSSIFLMGILPSGESLRMEVAANPSLEIPINKISVKQKLDLLIAQAWFNSSNRLKEQIVELSCKESVPCAHTTMVIYETKPGLKKENIFKDKRFRKNLLIGVGAVFVIGVVAVAFGDIMGSMGHTVDAVQGITHTAQGGCGSCGSGGDSCTCGDCGDCGVCCCDCNCADGDCGCCGCEVGNGHCDCGGCDCGGCGDCGGCDCNC